MRFSRLATILESRLVEILYCTVYTKTLYMKSLASHENIWSDRVHSQPSLVERRAHHQDHQHLAEMDDFFVATNLRLYCNQVSNGYPSWPTASKILIASLFFLPRLARSTSFILFDCRYLFKKILPYVYLAFSPTYPSPPASTRHSPNRRKRMTSARWR